MQKNALIIMTKAPEPGQVKTRLVPPLTFAEAADLARALLADQLESVAQFGGAELFIAFTPDEALGYFENFATLGFSCFAQKGGDLGARMISAFKQVFEFGFGNVVLIGSDLPALPLITFERAYASLEKPDRDLVFGPSEDGGYYLVGMARPIFDIFQGIAWSRNDVLARSIEKLAEIGVNYELLNYSYDIDTLEDLKRLQSDCERHHLGMNNTLTLLRQLKQRGIVS